MYTNINLNQILGKSQNTIWKYQCHAGTLFYTKWVFIYTINYKTPLCELRILLQFDVIDIINEFRHFGVDRRSILQVTKKLQIF